MDPKHIALTFLRQYPQAQNLNRNDLESAISRWITDSYSNAVATVSARKAFKEQPKQSEIDTMKLLSLYINNVSPIADCIRPADNPNLGSLADPSQMSFSEYSSYRNSGNQHGSRVSTYHTGRGLFD